MHHAHTLSLQDGGCHAIQGGRPCAAVISSAAKVPPSAYLATDYFVGCCHRVMFQGLNYIFKRIFFFSWPKDVNLVVSAIVNM